MPSVSWRAPLMMPLKAGRGSWFSLGVEWKVTRGLIFGASYVLIVTDSQKSLHDISLYMSYIVTSKRTSKGGFEGNFTVRWVLFSTSRKNSLIGPYFSLQQPRNFLPDTGSIAVWIMNSIPSVFLRRVAWLETAERFSGGTSKNWSLPGFSARNGHLTLAACIGGLTPNLIITCRRIFLLIACKLTYAPPWRIDQANSRMVSGPLSCKLAGFVGCYHVADLLNAAGDHGF